MVPSDLQQWRTFCIPGQSRSLHANGRKL